MTGLRRRRSTRRRRRPWELEYACGQDALDTDFKPIPRRERDAAADHGHLGTISEGDARRPRDQLRRRGCRTTPAVRRAGGRLAGESRIPTRIPSATRSSSGSPSTRPAARTTSAGTARRSSPTRRRQPAGWPRPIGAGSNPTKLVTGSGGETSPRLYDVDGDNSLDVIQATSSGELYVLHSDGTPVARFNGGEPVHTDRSPLERHHPPPGVACPPRESLRVPVIGDIDGDHEAEIVATAGEHVYAWEPRRHAGRAGSRCGSTRRSRTRASRAWPNPASTPADRAITAQNHIKRGFFGSAALADLDGDGAWTSSPARSTSTSTPGTGLGAGPARLPGEAVDAPAPTGAEIITTPAIAQLDGHGPPEVDRRHQRGDPGQPGARRRTIFDICQRDPRLEYRLEPRLCGARRRQLVERLAGDGRRRGGGPAADGAARTRRGRHGPDGDGNDEVVGVGRRHRSSDRRRPARRRRRLVDHLLRQRRPGQPPTRARSCNLADYPSIGDITGPARLGRQGRDDAERRRQPARRQPEPPLQPRRAGLGSGAPGTALPGFPRADRRFPAPLRGRPIARVAGSRPRRARRSSAPASTSSTPTGPAASSPAGWPKFTGGWIESTPAVGDIDGDGKLDVSALTREGWSVPLGYRASTPATTPTSEWWTFHHDEHSTAQLRHRRAVRPERSAISPRPPAPTAPAMLDWKEPGDDWLCGSPTAYQDPGLGQPDPLARRRPRGRPSDAATRSRRRPRVTQTLSAADIGSATPRRASCTATRPATGACCATSRYPRPTPTGPTGPTASGTSPHGAPDLAHRPRRPAPRPRAPAIAPTASTAATPRTALTGTGGRGSRSAAGRRRATASTARPAMTASRARAARDRVSGGCGDDQLTGRPRPRPHQRRQPATTRSTPPGGGRDRINCGPGNDTVYATRRAGPGRANCE